MPLSSPQGRKVLHVPLLPGEYRAGPSYHGGGTGAGGSRANVSYRCGIVYLMPRGDPSPKLAITVDPDVHRRVVAAAADDGVSVSAWMTNAARRALLVRDGLQAVAEWEAEQGAFTEVELAAARRRVADEVPHSTAL